jgi:hypothetical protein
LTFLRADSRLAGVFVPDGGGEVLCPDPFGLRPEWSLLASTAVTQSVGGVAGSRGANEPRRAQPVFANSDAPLRGIPLLLDPEIERRRNGQGN